MGMIAYKKSNLVVNAIGCALMAAASIWALFMFDNWKVRIFCGFLAVTLPFISYALFAKALGSCLAFAFDAKTLTVATVFEKETITWPDVFDISREILQQSSAFGLIKREIGKRIVVSYYKRGKLCKLEVDEALLDLPKDSADALIATLMRASEMAHAGPTAPVPPRSGASGRYQPAHSSGLQPSPTFGRKLS
jgi:hypothetical protein